MTTLEKIADILSEVEFADDTAEKLYGLMAGFNKQRTLQKRRAFANPEFGLLWEALAEAVDHSCGFDPADGAS